MYKSKICLWATIICTQLNPFAGACPFCSPVLQTLSEEIESMDVAVIARVKLRANMSAVDLNDPLQDVPETLFEITDVIQGVDNVDVGDEFEAIYLEEADDVLVMAAEASNQDWMPPLSLTERTAKYILALSELPSGPERLEFFQDYLEDEDELLAQDAYGEFTRASYPALLAFKSRIKRQRLIQFIHDVDVPIKRRRLYFTMLGVCGTPQDAKMLEEFIESDDSTLMAGLDAMLACYVSLTGEEGLDKIDQLFLKNYSAEYGDTNAAIMAIRFHGSEANVVAKQRLAKSLRHVLDRPDIADLVIADLAKWEDWGVLEKLCQLFIDADKQASLVRVPVINFLRSCPLPIAKKKLEELELVDPVAVQRALLVMPEVTDDSSQVVIVPNDFGPRSTIEHANFDIGGSDETSVSLPTYEEVERNDSTDTTEVSIDGAQGKVGQLVAALFLLATLSLLAVFFRKRS